MREAGYEVVVDSWTGMFLPARAAAAIVNALNTALATALRSPRIMETLAMEGNEPALQTPEQFAATIAADLARWGPVVKASGFVAED
jgi:tripartite-type tricarboxylate transporter receptor subunit TctC